MEPETYTMMVNGKKQTLTHDESILAMHHDYIELLKSFAPSIVRIDRCVPPAGSGALLKITVDTSKYRTGGLYYLDSSTFSTPKETTTLSFFLDIRYGYPAVKPLVYYPVEKRNAHINVFDPDVNNSFVSHCYGDWEKDSSLFSVARKVILSIIHDESVAGYGSTATRTPSLIAWQRSMARNGKFPAINPNLIYRKRRHLL